jgi:hypothetical protein
MAKSDVNREIRDRVQSFVQELSELVKQATLESVQSALQGGPVGVLPMARGGRRGGAAQPKLAPGRRGGKRTADELESLASSLLRHIQSNPGQRMEQLSASLDIASKELTLPIKKLMQENRLRTKGQKRATAYYAR